MNTKEKILQESLKLFSIKGFASTSIREIAKEVNITNSGLYKHFKSKEDIFTTLVEDLKIYYGNVCKEIVNAAINNIEDVKRICLGMFHFQNSDNKILMFRKMLIIEQFSNHKMAEIYQEFFIEAPLRSQITIFTKLIENKMMKNLEPRVMAMELYAPFYMYHLVDINQSILEEYFLKHIEYFLSNYLVKME